MATLLLFFGTALVGLVCRWDSNVDTPYPSQSGLRIQYKKDARLNLLFFLFLKGGFFGGRGEGPSTER